MLEDFKLQKLEDFKTVELKLANEVREPSSLIDRLQHSIKCLQLQQKYLLQEKNAP